jgi:hypothetical protein
MLSQAGADVNIICLNTKQIFRQSFATSFWIFRHSSQALGGMTKSPLCFYENFQSPQPRPSHRFLEIFAIFENFFLTKKRTYDKMPAFSRQWRRRETLSRNCRLFSLVGETSDTNNGGEGTALQTNILQVCRKKT